MKEYIFCLGKVFSNILVKIEISRDPAHICSELFPITSYDAPNEMFILVTTLELKLIKTEFEHYPVLTPKVKI